MISHVENGILTICLQVDFRQMVQDFLQQNKEYKVVICLK